jgi:hypothetical protein
MPDTGLLPAVAAGAAIAVPAVIWAGQQVGQGIQTCIQTDCFQDGL